MVHYAHYAMKHVTTTARHTSKRKTMLARFMRAKLLNVQITPLAQLATGNVHLMSLLCHSFRFKLNRSVGQEVEQGKSNFPGTFDDPIASYVLCCMHWCLIAFLNLSWEF